MNSNANTIRKNTTYNKNKKVSKRSRSFTNHTISSLVKNHRLAALDSFNYLYHAPFSNLLTIFILGVTLALPLLLYLIIFNINSSLINWQQNLYNYTIYLDSGYSESKVTDLQHSVSNWLEVDKVEVIDKTQGLEELKKAMGISELLSNIQHNPLPTVLIVNLKNQFHNVDKLKELIDKSSKLKGIDKIDADIFWVEKVVQLLKIFSMVINVFAVALGLAVLLVIGNTIRLNLQAKHTDMSIYSLLGATDSYIRRPYLYGGLLYGFFTGLIGLAISKILFAKLYNLVSTFAYTELISTNIHFITMTSTIEFLLTSSFLGWLGARITLHWQLGNLKRKLVEL